MDVLAKSVCVQGGLGSGILRAPSINISMLAKKGGIC